MEYCYRYRDRHPDAHILWVYSSTFMRLEQAYQEIARKLALPRWEDPKTDTLRLVCDWLGEAGNGRWLMVIDNADDIETFFTRPEPSGWNGGRDKPLVDYLPTKPERIVDDHYKRQAGGRETGRQRFNARSRVYEFRRGGAAFEISYRTTG